ncbi:hypothetical protein MHJ97_12470 [Macrococcus epidermidis]|uniref:hypothetical protein n=1 Tax=Macrococcus epidermidis TaxID=1902580 RepID=UPI001EF197C4|nr:hypothetical protein [Macrococcus epidermidis]MCG7421221.1 hypothetical protein [Macrococcus epidermidis]
MSIDEKYFPVYHVLMTANENNSPKIYVGEKLYSLIDIEKIKVIGPTSEKYPSNFKFTDGLNVYKYTSADSQLYMNFKNKDIILESWDVNFVENPIEVFNKLNVEEFHNKNIFVDSVSWRILNHNGEVEKNSGFNAFDGAPKLPKKNNYRENLIIRLIEEAKNQFNEDIALNIEKLLNAVILKEYSSKDEKE